MDANGDSAVQQSETPPVVNSVTSVSRLDQLTSLRFFAAFAVLVYHTSFLKRAGEPWASIASTVFDEGYAGVPFFFILSGFILSHTYQEGLTSGRISARKYLLLRGARIFPLHWLVAVVLIIVAYNPSQYVWETVANLLLLQVWVPDPSYYSLNGVTWTLGVELFFYGTLICLVRLSTKAVAALCLLWTVAICLGAIVSIRVHGTHIGGGPILWVFLISPVVRLLDFLTGVLAYRLFSLSHHNPRFASEGLSVLLLLLAVALYSTHKPPDLLRYQIVYLPFMAYVIFSFARGDGLFSYLLRHPTLVMLGDASFALYMIHQPMIQLTYRAYLGRGFSFSLVLLALFLVLLCVGTAAVVYKFVEYPIHRYLRMAISRSA
jgi:peptidoglycan/LPS O-acetylase OafA/YrhL